MQCGGYIDAYSRETLFDKGGGIERFEEENAVRCKYYKRRGKQKHTVLWGLKSVACVMACRLPECLRGASRNVYTDQRLTTRVSSLRNSRRYLAISAAIPLGSLMRLLRRSFRTPRRPSFHCCFSSVVLPGLAVPSCTSSVSPTRVQVSLRTREGWHKSMPFCSVRTSDTQLPEVLFSTCRVIAGPTSSFVRAHWLLRINLMAKGCRQEAACNILRKLGVVTVRFEHAKRAFIGREFRRPAFIVGRRHLSPIS
jgi:hypothetical protein